MIENCVMRNEIKMKHIWHLLSMYEYIFVFLHPENYRLQSAYENNLIIKMVFVSHASVCDRIEIPS